MRWYNAAMKLTPAQLCKEILRLGSSKCVLSVHPVAYLKLAGLGIIGSKKHGLTSYGRQVYFKLLRGEECPEVR